MIEIYENSKKEDYLKIFNSHPELAIEKTLTKIHKRNKVIQI